MTVSTVSDRALTPPHAQSLFVGCFRKAVGYPKSACFFKCCFTSTLTVRFGTESPGRPPTLSPISWTLRAIRSSSNVVLRLHRPYGLFGTEAQDVHLDSHTAPELWPHTILSCPINNNNNKKYSILTSCVLWSITVIFNKMHLWHFWSLNIITFDTST